MVAKGPDHTVVRSSTRIPRSGGEDGDGTLSGEARAGGLLPRAASRDAQLRRDVGVVLPETRGEAAE